MAHNYFFILAGYATLFVVRRDFLTKELGYIDKIAVSIGPGLIIALLTFIAITGAQAIMQGKDIDRDVAAGKTFEIILAYGSVIITFKLLGLI